MDEGNGEEEEVPRQERRPEQPLRADAGDRTPRRERASAKKRSGDTPAGPWQAPWWAARATSKAPRSARGSVCVRRALTRTKLHSFSLLSPRQTPRSADRMAGPLPADQTPLLPGG